MSSLAEIESAADQLPVEDQALLLEYLVKKLGQTKEVEGGNLSPSVAPPQWPDFAARARAIYGDRVMPNVILQEREGSYS